MSALLDELEPERRARREHQAQEQAEAERQVRLAAEKAETERQERKQQIANLVSQLTQAESSTNRDKVIELGERILKLDAEHQPTRSNTAAAYAAVAERYDYGEEYDSDDAIAYYSRAIGLDPFVAHYHFRRGYSYYRQNDYDRAIANCNRAIELDPNAADYYHWRNYSFYSKGDYDHAIDDCNHAIELDPNNADYYVARGRSYDAKNDYDLSDCGLYQRHRARTIQGSSLLARQVLSREET